MRGCGMSMSMCIYIYIITAAGLFSRVAASLSEIEENRWNTWLKQYPLGAPTPHDFRQTRKKGVTPCAPHGRCRQTGAP